jgi:hypothetical protein
MPTIRVVRPFSHILTSMVTRLTVLALAVVIGGAPVVTTACEALCAARANESGTTGEHHTCHHETSPAHETAISPVPHVCGHSDDSPSAVAQSLSVLEPPAIIVVAFTLAPPALAVAHGGVTSAHDPPLISPRPAQLRI